MSTEIIQEEQQVSTEIVLKQMPVIVHQLQEAGKTVQKRIDELELEKQVLTEETVKTMKNLRAELNKEFEDFEQKRGILKKAYNKVYDEFDQVYKSEITDRYSKAKTSMTAKIDQVELKIKKDKEKNIKEYFDELLISENIDFLKFENVGLKIDLSTSEKKFKEKVYAFIEKTNDDIALIKATDYEAETMTEYKKTLNVSKAITDVKTRKDLEAKELARIKAEQRKNRETYLSKLGLNYVEITNAWEFNADIYVSLSDVINLPKETFTEKYEELKVKIKALQDAEIKPETSTENQTVTEEPKQTISVPITAPTVETPAEPIKTASFEVKATMTKLRALGEYMKSQSIEYKNI